MDQNAEYRHKARRYRVLICAKVVRIIGVVVPALGFIYAAIVLSTPEGHSLDGVAHVMYCLFAVVAFGVASFVASHLMEMLGDIEENTRGATGRDAPDPASGSQRKR
ncbi:MAG: hypothetical protein JW889_06660 [Verrucomicrobia bacterium]|nr:hypothetical protein [Verrucomicrobiota bacterium]